MPLAALVLTWLMTAAAVGTADAVRLLAAVTLVRAARALTLPATLPPLRSRVGGSEHRRSAMRVALAVELAALVGTLLALAGILALLWSAGQRAMLLLCVLFATALPVRLAMPLAAARTTFKLYRLNLAFIGVAVVGGGLIAGADVFDFALLFALREWLALAIAFLLAGRVEPHEGQVGPLRWREIATLSLARSRKTAAYRFSKGLLHALLGPFGTIAARTGRGMRLDRRLERFVPRHPAAAALVALVLAAGAVALILLVPEPALLVVAASLLRMAAAAGNMVIWGVLAGDGEGLDGGDSDAEEL